MMAQPVRCPKPRSRVSWAILVSMRQTVESGCCNSTDTRAEQLASRHSMHGVHMILGRQRVVQQMPGHCIVITANSPRGKAFRFFRQVQLHLRVARSISATA